MCMGGSTQSTTIPEMTPQEQELLQMMTSTLLPAYLDQAGYDVSTSQVTWEESDEYKELASFRSEVEAVMRDDPSGLTRVEAPWGETLPAVNARGAIDDRMREGEASFTPHTTFDLEKRPSDAEVADEVRRKLQGIEDEYGRDSQEYKDALSEFSTEQQRAFQRDEIQAAYLDRVQSYLEGDISVTPEQERFIQEQYAPIREVVDQLYSDSMEEVDSRYAKFAEEIDKTNMSISQALDVVGSQIKETGANMEKALESTVTANRELMKMGIEDATGQITKNISMQAISTGRDPSDPEYTNEIQTNIARQVKEGNLQLTAYEGQNRMAIAERTGSGLEGVAEARARLAEATGAKREGAIMAQGQERQGIIQQRGQQRLATEESVSNLRTSMAMGLPPSQISAGSGYSQLQTALASQRLANLSGTMQSVGYPYSLYSAERFAQPTTTVTRNAGFMDFLGLGLGAGSAAAGMYGGFSQAGYYNAAADRLRGGM